MTDHAHIKGRRVLVVEDEALIAMLMETLLEDMGCEVVGPAHAVASALNLVEDKAHIDAALLDLNLAGETSFPVADALRARGVPIIFCTGYGDSGLREIDRGATVLRKPYRADDLTGALNAALGKASSGAA